jgi:hypothetical protein
MNKIEKIKEIIGKKSEYYRGYFERKDGEINITGFVPEHIEDNVKEHMLEFTDVDGIYSFEIIYNFEEPEDITDSEYWLVEE